MTIRTTFDNVRAWVNNPDNAIYLFAAPAAGTQIGVIGNALQGQTNLPLMATAAFCTVATATLMGCRIVRGEPYSEIPKDASGFVMMGNVQDNALFNRFAKALDTAETRALNHN